MKKSLLFILLMLSAVVAWAQDPASIGSIRYNSAISAYEIKSVANLNDLAVYVNGSGQYGANTYSNGTTGDGQAHNCAGMTFKMTADIHYPYTTAWDAGPDVVENNYTPIGGLSSYFCGFFDGQNHTVSGIRIHNSSMRGLGLFGYLTWETNANQEGVIKNVTVTDSRFTGGSSTVGAIAGYGRIIDNCHSTATVAINGLTSNSRNFGGIAGELNGTSAYLQNCTSAAHIVNCYKSGGGIVGFNNVSVTNCTSRVTFTGGSGLGGIVGWNNGGSVTDCLAVGVTMPEGSGSAILSFNSGTARNDYYLNCRVGYSTIGIGPDNLGNGVSSLHSITFKNGVSASPTKVVDGNPYYAYGSDVWLSHPDTPPTGWGDFDRYTVKKGDNSFLAVNGSKFTMPRGDVEVSCYWMKKDVPYIDENGTEQKVDARVVDADLPTKISDGWYVVLGDVTIERINSEAFNINGSHMHLILADGCTLNFINATTCFKDYNSVQLSIYGQRAGTGTLNATASNEAINLNRLVINGGNVNVTSTRLGETNAINIEKGSGLEPSFIMNGGNVVVQGEYGGIFAREKFVFNGGTLSVKGLYSVRSYNYYFDWKNPDDYFCLIGAVWSSTPVFNKKFAFNNNGTITEVTESNYFDNSTYPTGRICRPAFTVSFDSNGGSAVNNLLAFAGTPVARPVAPTRQGFNFAGWKLGDRLYDFSSPVNSDITLTAVWTNNPGDFSGSGTDEDPYLIKTEQGWNFFCDYVLDRAFWNCFEGKTAKLVNDISVTRMAGNGDCPFQGTFDGGNHTLTVNYNDTVDFVAPFPVVSNTANFRNLTIGGTITTTGGYAAGLVGHLFGRVNVEHCKSEVEITAAGVGSAGFVGLCEHSVNFVDCLSSTVIHCGTGHNSGFIGWSRSSGWTINFEGCVFNGKLLKSNVNSSGNSAFIGWKGDNKTVNITNCLYAPAALEEGEAYANSGATFCNEHANYASTKNHCYYTKPIGTAQGTQVYSITAGNNVTVEEYQPKPSTSYSMTETSFWQNADGLIYDGKIHAVSNSQQLVNLYCTPPEGRVFDRFEANATIQGSANPYTIIIPSHDVIVSAIYKEILGDLNRDGVVDVSDVNICINIVLEFNNDPEVKALADLTGDGAVDVSDVNALINIVLEQ